MNATDSAVAVISFDYANLDPDLAAKAREAAARIRDRSHTTIMAIGRELITIKAEMDHGTFGKWIAAEMGMTIRTAENYMNAARWVEGKSETVSHLPPAAVYALAAPSAPVAVVNEVLAAVEAGNVMSAATIKTKLATAIAAEQHAAREAKKPPEQVAKERKARESAAKRRERKAAELAAQRAEEARREQERTDRLNPLVKRIGSAIGHQDLVALVKVLQGNDWVERQTALRLLTELSKTMRTAETEACQ